MSELIDWLMKGVDTLILMFGLLWLSFLTGLTFFLSDLNFCKMAETCQNQFEK